MAPTVAYLNAQCLRSSRNNDVRSYICAARMSSQSRKISPPACRRCLFAPSRHRPSTHRLIRILFFLASTMLPSRTVKQAETSSTPPPAALLAPCSIAGRKVRGATPAQGPRALPPSPVVPLRPRRVSAAPVQLTRDDLALSNLLGTISNGRSGILD